MTERTKKQTTRKAKKTSTKKGEVTAADQLTFNLGTFTENEVPCLILRMASKAEKKSMEIAIPTAKFFDLLGDVFKVKKDDADWKQMFT